MSFSLRSGRRRGRSATPCRPNSPRRTEAFGPGTSVTYLGLEPGLGNAEPPVLLRYGRESIEVLSDPEFEAPDEASAEQLREHVAEIAPAVKKLEAVVKEHETQKRKTQKALKLKVQRLESCHEAVLYGSRLNEALYVLAGESFLAARLRPPVGRGGSADPVFFPTDDDVDESEPDNESATGEATAEPTGSEASADEEAGASDASQADDAPAS